MRHGVVVRGHRQRVRARRRDGEQVAPHGLSAAPPFYRIDRRTNTMEPRPPVADRDWEAIIAVMEDEGITGLNANGQMTDAALERLSHLDHVTRLNLDGSKRLTDAGVRHLGEQLPERREQPGVGGRVRARRPPDRRLVNVDHLVQVLQPADPIVQAGPVARLVQ